MLTYKTAIEQFFCVVEACCGHFISDEHWGEFDDMYDPDYSMLGTYRRFADAIKNGSMPAAFDLTRTKKYYLEQKTVSVIHKTFKWC